MDGIAESFKGYNAMMIAEQELSNLEKSKSSPTSNIYKNMFLQNYCLKSQPYEGLQLKFASRRDPASQQFFNISVGGKQMFENVRLTYSVSAAFALEVEANLDEGLITAINVDGKGFETHNIDLYSDLYRMTVFEQVKLSYPKSILTAALAAPFAAFSMVGGGEAFVAQIAQARETADINMKRQIRNFVVKFPGHDWMQIQSTIERFEAYKRILYWNMNIYQIDELSSKANAFRPMLQLGEIALTQDAVDAAADQTQPIKDFRFKLPKLDKAARAAVDPQVAEFLREVKQSRLFQSDGTKAALRPVWGQFSSAIMYQLLYVLVARCVEAGAKIDSEQLTFLKNCVGYAVLMFYCDFAHQYLYRMDIVNQVAMMRFRDTGIAFPDYQRPRFGMEDGVFLFGGLQAERNIWRHTHLQQLLQRHDGYARIQNPECMARYLLPVVEPHAFQFQNTERDPAPYTFARRPFMRALNLAAFLEQYVYEQVQKNLFAIVGIYRQCAVDILAKNQPYTKAVKLHARRQAEDYCRSAYSQQRTTTIRHKLDNFTALTTAGHDENPPASIFADIYNPFAFDVFVFFKNLSSLPFSQSLHRFAAELTKPPNKPNPKPNGRPWNLNVKLASTTLQLATRDKKRNPLVEACQEYSEFISTYPRITIVHKNKHLQMDQSGARTQVCLQYQAYQNGALKLDPNVVYDPQHGECVVTDIVFDRADKLSMIWKQIRSLGNAFMREEQREIVFQQINIFSRSCEEFGFQITAAVLYVVIKTHLGEYDELFAQILLQNEKYSSQYYQKMQDEFKLFVAQYEQQFQPSSNPVIRVPLREVLLLRYDPVFFYEIFQIYMFCAQRPQESLGTDIRYLFWLDQPAFSQKTQTATFSAINRKLFRGVLRDSTNRLLCDRKSEGQNFLLFLARPLPEIQRDAALQAPTTAGNPQQFTNKFNVARFLQQNIPLGTKNLKLYFGGPAEFMLSGRLQFNAILAAKYVEKSVAGNFAFKNLVEELQVRLAVFYQLRCVHDFPPDFIPTFGMERTNETTFTIKTAAQQQETIVLKSAGRFVLNQTHFAVLSFAIHLFLKQCADPEDNHFANLVQFMAANRYDEDAIALFMTEIRAEDNYMHTATSDLSTYTFDCVSMHVNRAIVINNSDLAAIPQQITQNIKFFFDLKAARDKTQDAGPRVSQMAQKYAAKIMQAPANARAGYFIMGAYPCALPQPPSKEKPACKIEIRNNVAEILDPNIVQLSALLLHPKLAKDKDSSRLMWYLFGESGCLFRVDGENISLICSDVTGPRIPFFAVQIFVDKMGALFGDISARELRLLFVFAVSAGLVALQLFLIELYPCFYFFNKSNSPKLAPKINMYIFNYYEHLIAQPPPNPTTDPTAGPQGKQKSKGILYSFYDNYTAKLTKIPIKSRNEKGEPSPDIIEQFRASLTDLKTGGEFRYLPHQQKEIKKLRKLYTAQLQPQKNLDDCQIMFSIFGSGKTDVYVPFLVFQVLCQNDYDNAIICVPEHLLDQTERGIFQKVVQPRAYPKNTTAIFYKHTSYSDLPLPALAALLAEKQTSKIRNPQFHFTMDQGARTGKKFVLVISHKSFQFLIQQIDKQQLADISKRSLLVIDEIDEAMLSHKQQTNTILRQVDRSICMMQRKSLLQYVDAIMQGQTKYGNADNITQKVVAQFSQLEYRKNLGFHGSEESSKQCGVREDGSTNLNLFFVSRPLDKGKIICDSQFEFTLQILVFTALLFKQNFEGTQHKFSQFYTFFEQHIEYILGQVSPAFSQDNCAIALTALRQTDPSITITRNLIRNIIADQFDKVYYPKTILCSNFYDVLLNFKSIVSFTGTPFVYPVTRLLADMRKFSNSSLRIALREPTDHRTIKAIQRYQLSNYFPNKPGGRYVKICKSELPPPQQPNAAASKFKISSGEIRHFITAELTRFVSDAKRATAGDASLPQRMREPTFVQNVMLLDPMGYLVEAELADVCKYVFEAFPAADRVLTVDAENRQILVDKFGGSLPFQTFAKYEHNKPVFAFLPMGQTIGVDFKDMQGIFQLIVLLSDGDGVQDYQAIGRDRRFFNRTAGPDEHKVLLLLGRPQIGAATSIFQRLRAKFDKPNAQQTIAQFSLFPNEETLMAGLVNIMDQYDSHQKSYEYLFLQSIQRLKNAKTFSADRNPYEYEYRPQLDLLYLLLEGNPQPKETFKSNCVEVFFSGFTPEQQRQIANTYIENVLASNSQLNINKNVVININKNQNTQLTRIVPRTPNAAPPSKHPSYPFADIQRQFYSSKVAALLRASYDKQNQEFNPDLFVALFNENKDKIMRAWKLLPTKEQTLQLNKDKAHQTTMMRAAIPAAAAAAASGMLKNQYAVKAGTISVAVVMFILWLSAHKQYARTKLQVCD